MVVDYVILDIGMSRSKCLACGLGATTGEKAHRTRLDYGEHDGKGCGRRFTHVTSSYSHLEKQVKFMRPDLEWINPSEAYEIYNDSRALRACD